jgi:hypothetical protein
MEGTSNIQLPLAEEANSLAERSMEVPYSSCSRAADRVHVTEYSDV